MTSTRTPPPSRSSTNNLPPVPEPLVLTEPRGDGVTVIRVQRPPLNALSHAVLAELATVADAVAADPAVKAVVVTGSDRAFAAGADRPPVGAPRAAPRTGAPRPPALAGATA